MLSSDVSILLQDSWSILGSDEAKAAGNQLWREEPGAVVKWPADPEVDHQPELRAAGETKHRFAVSA